MASKNPHAVELGRQGGRAKTPQKTNAARQNGRKSGRPPVRRSPEGAESGSSSAGRRRANSQGATTRPFTDEQAGTKRMTRRLVSAPGNIAGTPPRLNGALANVDDQLRNAVAALNSEDINYWEFRDATGRGEAHSYYQYPAMMVPSMRRILLQRVLRLQPGIRELVDPFAGSGTLMVEGMCEGLNVTAYDINPLAVLLCRAKSEVFDAGALRDSDNIIPRPEFRVGTKKQSCGSKAKTEQLLRIEAGLCQLADSRHGRPIA